MQRNMLSRDVIIWYMNTNIHLSFSLNQHGKETEKKKVGQNHLEVPLKLPQNCQNFPKIVEIAKNFQMMKKTQLLKLKKLISALIVDKFLNFLFENEVERYINN